MKGLMCMRGVQACEKTLFWGDEVDLEKMSFLHARDARYEESRAEDLASLMEI